MCLQTRNGQLQAVFDSRTYKNKATHPNSIVRVELALHFMSQAASHVLLPPTKEPRRNPSLSCAPRTSGPKRPRTASRSLLPKGLLAVDVKRQGAECMALSTRAGTLSAHLT